MGKEQVRKTVAVTEDLVQRVEALSATRYTNFSQVTREALAFYLEHVESNSPRRG